MLTEAWCDLWAEAAAGVDTASGPAGALEIRLRIEGREARSFTLFFDDGALVNAKLGSHSADVHCEMAYETYVAFAGGDRSVLQRATLQGAVRLTGDPDLAEEIMALLHSGPQREVRRRVHERTLY
jgi:SCP-2 sterol transfer family protein